MTRRTSCLAYERAKEEGTICKRHQSIMDFAVYAKKCKPFRQDEWIRWASKTGDKDDIINLANNTGRFAELVNYECLEIVGIGENHNGNKVSLYVPTKRFLTDGPPILKSVSNEWRQAYYLTPHYRKIRRDRWSFDKGKCVVCKDPGTECHHIVYHLFQEVRDDLLTVCSKHHTFLHEEGNANGFPQRISKKLHDRIVIPKRIVEFTINGKKIKGHTRKSKHATQKTNRRAS